MYALCSAWNREPEETIRRFKKGNENEWLVSVIPGKGRIYFSHVCEYMQETELYQTYQWACAFVHGQDIRSIQAGIEGEAAKSTAVMLHYNKNRADIYIPAALIALDEDHVITIKAGMVFPTGYYVEQDMVFTYSAATQKLSTTSVTDLSLIHI